MLNKLLIDLLNKCEPHTRAMLFVVPTKMVRVIAADESFKTFRVEQLQITNQHNMTGTWRLLSTHGSEQPGASYHDACEAAIKAQQKIISQLQQRAPKLMVPA